jgi:hypothetical protein
VSDEEIPVGVALRRRRKDTGRYQRPAVRAVDPDGLDHRHCIGIFFELTVQRFTVLADISAGHARDQVRRIAHRQIGQFEGLGRFFLQNVKRAKQALVGQDVEIAVGSPGRESEKRAGQQDCCGHSKPDQADGLRPLLHESPKPQNCGGLFDESPGHGKASGLLSQRGRRIHQPNHQPKETFSGFDKSGTRRRKNLPSG